MILGKNRDNWRKRKYTKLKESRNTSTLTKVAKISQKYKMPPVDLVQTSRISL